MQADARGHRRVVEVRQRQGHPQVGADDADLLADLVPPGPAVTATDDDEGARRFDRPGTEVDLAMDGRAVDEVDAQRDGPAPDLDGRRLESIAPGRHHVARPT